MVGSEQQLDDACARIAFTTMFPTFERCVYAFEAADPAAGRLLRLGGGVLPGEIGVAVPAMGGECFELRAARCRILLEDALAEQTTL